MCVCVCVCAQTGKLSHPMGPPLQAPSEKPGVVGGTDGKALLPQLESLLPSRVRGVGVQCADGSEGRWDVTGWGQMGKAPLSTGTPLTGFLPCPQQQKSIAAMESIMEALCKSGSLFEVSVPDYKQLKACHKEVRLLKELWDMIIMVRGRSGLGGGQGRQKEGEVGEGSTGSILAPRGHGSHYPPMTPTSDG